MADKTDIKKRTADQEKIYRQMEFLWELYQENPSYLTDKDIADLKKYKYIKEEKEDLPKPEKEYPKYHTSKTKTDAGKAADEFIDIIQDNEGAEVKEEVISEKTYDDVSNDKRYKWKGGVEIRKSDWMPKSVIYHTDEFVAWIDSILSGFQKMIPYKPFQMYCQQAENWLQDKGDIHDFETTDQRREFAWNEIDRFAENSLYFLDKYVNVKEPDLGEDGSWKYESKPVHKVLAFMLDCGYSMEIGKPRQIAATTTMGALAVCKLLTKRNYFIKMVAQNDDKVQEIFEDKVKFVASDLPEWLEHKQGNDSGTKLSFVLKERKGKRGGANSRMEVVPPATDAINGGAPPLVLIDEAGYIGILGKMIAQGRPVMFRQDPKTGKIKQSRQVVIWGTGGEMDKKGKAYEEEFSQTLKAWKKRQFEKGIIPLFFDWTTRPGMTQEHFDREKRIATVEGPEADQRMIEFRQTYPEIVEDMFMTSLKTLVPISYINERLRVIHKLDDDQRSEYGYFTPIFDYDKPSKEHDDLPYEVIGAEFIPTRKGDPLATCEIFMRPKPNWKDRYYQGTDPIASDNGYSNMASCIWDAHYNTMSAMVNFRDQNPKYVFQQVMLLGLYYDVAHHKKAGVPELVESNIGMAYTQFKEYKGFGRSLVLRSELNEIFQGGQTLYGIDNRGNRSRFIINKMHELIEMYGDRIFIETFWDQLGKFICTVTDKGTETWGTQDVRKYFDDVLFGGTFSYICASSFEFKPPKNLERTEENVKYKYKLARDANGNLYRKQVRA